MEKKRYKSKKQKMFTLLNVLSIYLTILNVKMRVFKIGNLDKIGN